MGGRLPFQIIDGNGSVIHHFPVGFGVEYPQGVGMDPPAGILGEQVASLVKPARQQGVVCHPIRGVTDGVHVHDHVAEAAIQQVAIAEFDHLEVGLGVRGAQVLDPQLPELPATALLRAFIPEARPRVGALELAGQAPLDVGPQNTGGDLGTKSEMPPSLVPEAVHLLLDHLGSLAHPPCEQVGGLEHGGGYIGIPVLFGQQVPGTEQLAPAPGLRGQYVVGALGRPEAHSHTQEGAEKDGDLGWPHILTSGFIVGLQANWTFFSTLPERDWNAVRGRSWSKDHGPA